MDTTHTFRFPGTRYPRLCEPCLKCPYFWNKYPKSGYQHPKSENRSALFFCRQAVEIDTDSYPLQVTAWETGEITSLFTVSSDYNQGQITRHTSPGFLTRWYLISKIGPTPGLRHRCGRNGPLKWPLVRKWSIDLMIEYDGWVELGEEGAWRS